MAEQSVEFPEDDAVDELYRPLKLAPQDRKITVGGEEYEIRAEVETDLFEISASKITEMSPLRCVNEQLLPLLMEDLDVHIIRAQIENREVRPVDLMKALSPPIEKLAKILEDRTKSIQKQRRALPK